MRRSLQAVGVLVAALAVVVGCHADDEPTCYAGDSEACSCPGPTEQRGYRACDVLRGAYGACVCDGTVGVTAAAPSDAGAVAVTTDAAPSKAALFAGCTEDADCESGVCREFPAKGGLLCTKECTGPTASTDCPAPSTGCNNQGICKAP